MNEFSRPHAATAAEDHYHIAAGVPHARAFTPAFRRQSGYREGKVSALIATMTLTIC